LRVPDGREGSPATKGPDPDEFIIGDDDSVASMSRSHTPQAVREGAGEGEGPGEDTKSVDQRGRQGENEEAGNEAIQTSKGKAKATESSSSSSGNVEELPEHVQVQRKLAHLEKLTVKYQGMVYNTSLRTFFILLTQFYLHRFTS
jgi:hypothetical protein